jgi:hypothetical protein
VLEPAELRARRERARKRRARAVHVIFQNSKFQINSGVSLVYIPVHSRDFQGFCLNGFSDFPIFRLFAGRDAYGCILDTKF